MAEKKQPKRRKRADGELSRERILDAATEISAERGYEGTSIALVSAKCGLPASSIYWHFKDKDDLIAAVIERSFGTWLSAWQVPEEGTAQGRAVSVAAQVAKALLDSPDFIRLGLMLTPELSDADVNQLATYALAGADGLFIAKEIGGDTVDLVALFELHARTVVDAARRLIDDAAGR